MKSIRKITARMAEFEASWPVWMSWNFGNQKPGTIRVI
jgi:hypothetical protein